MADDLKQTGKADDERIGRPMTVRAYKARQRVWRHSQAAVLSLLFTPRASPEIPVTVGPVRGVRIQGNTMRDADSGAVLAECDHHHWVFAGKAFYRADCARPVAVHVEECEGPKRFGPFKHFSLSDGMAYVDRAVFAQLNSSNKWYVERVNTECSTLLLLSSDTRK